MTRIELQNDMESRVKKAQEMLGDTSKAEEYKSLVDQIGKIGEQIRGMDKAEAELRAVKDAEAKMPQPQITEQSGWAGVRKQLLDAVNTGRRTNIDIGGIERRAWAGATTNTAPGIVRALIDGGKLRRLVNVAYGKNANTVVQAMTTSPAIPVGTAPGATGTSSDSTAVYGGDTMTLKAWYSTLPIPMSVLLDGALESELPALFADNFGAAIDKGILVGAGSGSDMLGTFIASASGVTTSQDIACASAGSPAWADYVGLALALLSLNGPTDSLAIVVNPSIIQTVIGAAANNDPLKTEYLMRQTILGIPVILSSYGLTTLTAGSYVAVGGYFKHYTLAVAQEITVDQIKTVGSDNITFQAFMYMQGKPTIGSSFRRLKTV